MATRGNRAFGGNPVAIETDPEQPLDVKGYDSTRDAQKVREAPGTPFRCAGEGTYTVKAAPGTLLWANVSALGTSVTMYDGPAATGTIIGAPAAAGPLVLGPIPFTTNLTVVIVGAGSVIGSVE